MWRCGGCSKVKLLRAVVREDMSSELASGLVSDMLKTLEWLDSHFVYTPEQVTHPSLALKL